MPTISSSPTISGKPQKYCVLQCCRAWRTTCNYISTLWWGAHRECRRRGCVRRTSPASPFVSTTSSSAAGRSASRAALDSSGPAHVPGKKTQEFAASTETCFFLESNTIHGVAGLGYALLPEVNVLRLLSSGGPQLCQTIGAHKHIPVS